MAAVTNARGPMPADPHPHPYHHPNLHHPPRAHHPSLPLPPRSH